MSLFLMMFYLVRIPGLVKKIYPDYIWDIPSTDKKIYLSFDDGPHETATPFVLDELKKFNAKATFFCIGKNVVAHPEIYRRIIDEGHSAGNHTFNHLNGNKTGDDEYIADIKKAADYIDSNLFRPPYGRITRFQADILRNAKQPYKIIMWNILSGDFDTSLSPEKCLENVVLKSRPGSIVVFHDSAKAWDRMSYALPRVLQHFADQGYSFEKLD